MSRSRSNRPGSARYAQCVAPARSPVRCPAPADAGDGRGLRQNPKRLRAPDLVASARRWIILARRKRQRRIHDRIHARQLAEALGHEGARTMVQESRVGVAGSGARPSNCLHDRSIRSCKTPCCAHAARTIRSRCREINCDSGNPGMPQRYATLSGSTGSSMAGTERTLPSQSRTYSMKF